MKQVIPDSAIAKQNEVKNLPNTEANKEYSPTEKQPNAKKAGLYSAILPGAGQLYNKQYWKIPLIYAGAGAAVYFFVNNQKNYRKYRQAYIARIDNDPATIDKEPLRTTEEIQYLQNEYKRWLDMTGLLTAVGYTLQILDAVVFAHLKEFDISRDISLKMQPVALPNGGIGFGLAMRWK
ncbi:MAG TPA: DUF5683 domain-containing protein [Flavipsychrobacter sp.]|nr:DUF5683 domain-containing protein [Flavipsychrobacter sp.]